MFQQRLVNLRQTFEYLSVRDKVLSHAYEGANNIHAHCYGLRAIEHGGRHDCAVFSESVGRILRSEEHTSELQSLAYLVCRLFFEMPRPPPISSLFPYAPSLPSLFPRSCALLSTVAAMIAPCSVKA